MARFDWMCALAISLAPPWQISALSAVAPVEFEVKLETALRYDGGDFIWFHPRAAAIPREGREPTVLMTIQKHLNISDYYSGLHVMTRESIDGAWRGPVLSPESHFNFSRNACSQWLVRSDGTLPRGSGGTTKRLRVRPLP